MATVHGSKLGTDKEVQAVTVNLKEQQHLEKKLQTLSIEETYAVKLLELNNRITKVGNEKRKGRITKIKSHLTVEEIMQMRKLELKGGLKPMFTSVNFSNASKIDAAHKRLKLETEREKRSRSYQSSATPATLTSSTGTIKSLRSQKTVPTSLRRRNSLPYMLSVAPSKTPASSVRTTDDTHIYDLTTPNVDRTRTNSTLDEEAQEVEDRPKTSQGFSSASYRTHSGRSSRGLAYEKKFCSHDLAEKEAYENLSETEKQDVSPQREGMGRFAHTDPFSDRNEEFKSYEKQKMEELGSRKMLFYKRVDSYNANNPSFSAKRHAPLLRQKSSVANMDKKWQNSTTSDALITILSEKEKRENAWKGLNKIRYLRIPDEKMDLSGVSTLATDNLQLSDLMRYRSRKNIANKNT